MIAVLAERRDTAARAVQDLLARRVPADQVVRVPPADLVRARWSHRMSGAGSVASRVHLPDGRCLAPDAVLHRIVGLPAGRSATNAKDRDYIASEFNALIASWLLSLGDRVLGPTSPYATALGPSPVTALVKAEQYGLPVPRRAHLTRAGLIGSPEHGERQVQWVEWPGAAGGPVPVEVVPDLPVTSRLLVVAGRVCGPFADRFGVAARSPATALDTSLLELSFADGPALVDATTMPRLDAASHVEAVVDALTVLAATSESRR